MYERCWKAITWSYQIHGSEYIILSTSNTRRYVIHCIIGPSSTSGYVLYFISLAVSLWYEVYCLCWLHYSPIYTSSRCLIHLVLVTRPTRKHRHFLVLHHRHLSTSMTSCQPESKMQRQLPKQQNRAIITEIPRTQMMGHSHGGHSWWLMNLIHCSCAFDTDHCLTTPTVSHIEWVRGHSSLSNQVERNKYLPLAWPAEEHSEQSFSCRRKEPSDDGNSRSCD